MACRAAPPPPLPVHAAPPTSPPAPPPPAAVPSFSGCTDLPLPDDISRPPALTKEQNHLLAEADPILAEPSEHGHAARRAFAQARALLDAKRWPEATRAFGEIALAYPHEDLGILSAMLYLEGLNLLGSLIEPPRPVCYDEMSARLPALQRLYCEDGENRRHPQECRLLFRIERDLERGGGCGIPSQPAEPPEARPWVVMADPDQCASAQVFPTPTSAISGTFSGQAPSMISFTIALARSSSASGASNRSSS